MWELTSHPVLLNLASTTKELYKFSKSQVPIMAGQGSRVESFVSAGGLNWSAHSNGVVSRNGLPVQSIRRITHLTGDYVSPWIILFRAWSDEGDGIQAAPATELKHKPASIHALEALQILVLTFNGRQRFAVIHRPGRVVLLAPGREADSLQVLQIKPQGV